MDKTNMPSTSNPPCRLRAAVKDACLHEKDGREFSAILQAGRLAANIIAGQYPVLTENPHLVFHLEDFPNGEVILAHLTAQMYTYWTNAPTGPSAHKV